MNTEQLSFDRLGYIDLVADLLDVEPARYLTIDVEDYTTTVSGDLSIDEESRLPSHLDKNLDKLLDAFGERKYRCTFFILGRVAERIKPQIRRMVAEGHEVASHGYSHTRVLELSPDDFRKELKASKALLEDISGEPVIGFRAPMFSITNESLWALDILRNEGFQYDSSVSPVSNFAYGVPNAPQRPHKLKNGLMEIPMSILKLAGKPLMVGGGFYLRFYPLWLHKAFLKFRGEGKETVFYLHPWELDPKDLNMWRVMPDGGTHWRKRPHLMKWIETHNRRNVLKKYLDIIDAVHNGPVVTMKDSLTFEMAKAKMSAGSSITSAL